MVILPVIQSNKYIFLKPHFLKITYWKSDYIKFVLGTQADSHLILSSDILAGQILSVIIYCDIPVNNQFSKEQDRSLVAGLLKIWNIEIIK